LRQIGRAAAQQVCYRTSALSVAPVAGRAIELEQIAAVHGRDDQRRVPLGGGLPERHGCRPAPNTSAANTPATAMMLNFMSNSPQNLDVPLGSPEIDHDRGEYDQQHGHDDDPRRRTESEPRSWCIQHSTHRVLLVSRLFSDRRSSSCDSIPPREAVVFTRQIRVGSSYSAQMIFVVLPSKSVTRVTLAPRTGQFTTVIAMAWPANS
jgi:hypothetical protein